MDMNDRKIYLKMKNKSWLNKEQHIIKHKKIKLHHE